ncbi:hypothetical protein [Arenimonas terrae]|uniref:Uncharacterized protein n=1 Tax=Arenimonas terrae TaxID=2546226 RepID=A0A5C4RVK9_9GAMM|nr:hypothetical protein [Arenimonas terrae]TNJ35054.1 hypothetical protein E1B00_04565 [Arenimonas terrae]
MLLSTLGLAAACALLNYAVNPIFLYRDGASVLDSGTRLHFAAHARTAKPMIIATRQPATLVLGSSRAELAFDPDHALLAPGGYNAALSGGTLAEAGQLLRHALRVSPPRRVLLVVNAYGDFHLRARGGLQRVEAWPEAMPWRLWHVLRGGVLLASPQLAWRSLQAIAAPGEYRGAGRRFAPDGQRGPEWAEHGLRRFGHYGLFRATLVHLFRHPAVDGVLEGNRALLASLVAEIPAGTELLLVAEPTHAVVYAAGEDRDRVYDRTTAGLQAMADLVRPGVAAWDCTGNTPLNAEAVPAKGDKRARMHWWLDASHYSPAYGTAMLDQFSRGDRSGPCRRLGSRQEIAASRARAKPAVIRAGRTILQALGREIP